MRNIGINVRPDVLYGAPAFIEAAAAAHFDSVFTYGNLPDFIDFTAKKCAETGLQYEALHAPCERINDLWLPGDGGEQVVEMLKTSLSLASEHGIPIVICHLSSKENAPHVTDLGLARFDTVVEEAAKRGVKIAVENQRKLGNLCTILEIYGKDSPVGFCWDVGHEACFSYGREYLPLFPDRCVFTHVHDNNRLYNVDEHLLPFDGQIDFWRVADLLHNAKYPGTLALEIDLPHEGSDKYADLSLEQFVSKAWAAINRLRIIAE
ncbi:MAG: sugar phosphate isomerase/epimerase [Clostridia bacterium]|nr:sugar phosphate isomerase/epimerase [Clostridia bacterium]